METLVEHYRQDVIDYVTFLTSDAESGSEGIGTWKEQWEAVWQRADFQPHHGLAFAGLLVELKDFVSSQTYGTTFPNGRQKSDPTYTRRWLSVA